MEPCSGFCHLLTTSSSWIHTLPLSFRNVLLLRSACFAVILCILGVKCLSQAPFSYSLVVGFTQAPSPAQASACSQVPER